MGHGRSKLMVSNRFTDKTDSIGFIFLCGEFQPFNFKLDNGKINEL